jgi:hypothetical protein
MVETRGFPLTRKCPRPISDGWQSCLAEGLRTASSCWWVVGIQATTPFGSPESMGWVSGPVGMKMPFSVLLPSGSRMSTDLDIQRGLLGFSDLNVQRYTANAAIRCLVPRSEIFRV